MWWGRVGFSFFLGQHTAAPVLTGSTRVHLPKSFLGKQLDNCTQEIWCFSSTSTIIIMDIGHVMRSFFQTYPKLLADFVQMGRMNCGVFEEFTVESSAHTTLSLCVPKGQLISEWNFGVFNQKFGEFLPYLDFKKWSNLKNGYVK